MMMGARTLRGFAALTRGYRVVRPLRGRQLRGIPVQMWHEDGDTTTACSGDGDGDDSIADALHRHRHEDRGTTATCCGDGDGDDVAPAILQRNGDGDGGPKGAELFCNRG